jgi:hypothetical protein
MTLPELCRASLADLDKQRKTADLIYQTALHAAVTAFGLDPRTQQINVNLDTGDVSVVDPQPESP